MADIIPFESPESNRDKEGDRPKRLSVAFSPAQSEHLQWLSQLQQIPQAEALRKALATESYIRQAVARGAKIYIEVDGSLKEIIFR
jgi:hypothetical protein